MNRHTYPDRRSAEADLERRDLKVGADVRCERDWPAAGTWKRYAGRVGRVVTLNVETFPKTGRVYVEVGVRFTNARNEPTTWFVPAELRRGYGLYKAPRSRAAGEGGQ